jgi:hypothetical protein
LSPKEGLRRETEKEKCPIQTELGTFNSTTTTLYASGASIGDDVQVQVLFRAQKTAPRLLAGRSFSCSFEQH